jgi:hypothetical protein
MGNPLVETPIYLQGMGWTQGGEPGEAALTDRAAKTEDALLIWGTPLPKPPYTYRVWGGSKGGNHI